MPSTPSPMRVIGCLEPPAFRAEDFPGFTEAQIITGLTVPAALLTEAEIEQAAKVCPVFRTIAGAAAVEPLLYECDCCGAKVTRDQIAMVIAYGIETAACDRCRGQEEGQ